MADNLLKICNSEFCIAFLTLEVLSNLESLRSSFGSCQSMETAKRSLRASLDSAVSALEQSEANVEGLRCRVEELQSALRTVAGEALHIAASRASVRSDLARSTASLRASEATLHDLATARAREADMRVRLGANLERAERRHVAACERRAAVEARALLQPPAACGASSAQRDALCEMYDQRKRADGYMLWSVRSAIDRATALNVDIEASAEALRVLEARRDKLQRELQHNRSKQSAQLRLISRR